MMNISKKKQYKKCSTTNIEITMYRSSKKQLRKYVEFHKNNKATANESRKIKKEIKIFL